MRCGGWSKTKVGLGGRLEGESRRENPRNDRFEVNEEGCDSEGVGDQRKDDGESACCSRGWIMAETTESTIMAAPGT